MRLQTNLVRRGARYYFRSRVPEDLKPHYGKSEFLISLKTSNRCEAERALVALKARLFEDYARLRGLGTNAPILPRLPARDDSKTESVGLDVELRQLVGSRVSSPLLITQRAIRRCMS